MSTTSAKTRTLPAVPVPVTVETTSIVSAAVVPCGKGYYVMM